MGVLFGALALLALAFGLVELARWLTVRKIRLRRQHWQPHARTGLPKHTLALFDIAAAQLLQQGFELVGMLAAQPQIVQDPRAEVFRELYFHPAEGVLAHVEQAPPMTGSPVKILYGSYFADRSALWTINREAHTSLPLPPAVELHDALASNWEQQWQAHLARVSAHPKANERVRSKARLLHFDEAQRDELLDWWLAQGSVQAAPRLRGEPEPDPRDPHYRLSLRAAFDLQRRMSRPGSAVLRALRQPFAPFKAPERGVQMMAEHDAAALTLAVQRTGTDPWVKTAVFVASAIAAALLFGFGFGLSSAIALMLVLLVHEAGHMLAMLATGYRNVSVFFLPGLGAMTSGHKLGARPWEEAVVLLAGPLPGIVLALGLLLGVDGASLSPWLAQLLREFAVFALVVNLFNLLPFSMLDGGQLFGLAVLSRLPVGKALFAAAGSFTLLVLAWLARDWLLALLAALMLAGVPLALRAARLVTAVRGKAEERAGGGDKLSAAQWLRGIYKTFASKDYAKLGWQTRQQLAALVLPRLTQAPPAWPLAVLLVLVQFACLVLPLALVLMAVRGDVDAPLWAGARPQGSAIQSSELERQWQAKSKAAWDQFELRYQRSGDGEARWSMLERAESGDEGELPFDEERLAWVRRQRALLAESFALTDPRRIDVLLEQAAERAAGPARAAQYREALDLLTDRGALAATAIDPRRLPQWVAARVGLLANLGRPQQDEGLPAVRAEWQELRAAGGKRALLALPLGVALAEQALARQDWAAAEALLRECIEVDAQPLSAEAVEAGFSAQALERRRDAQQRRLAWLWIQSARHDEAIAAADRHLARPLPAPSVPGAAPDDGRRQQDARAAFARQQQWRQVLVWAQHAARRDAQAWVAYQAFEEGIDATMRAVVQNSGPLTRLLMPGDAVLLAPWRLLDRMALRAPVDPAGAARDRRLLLRRHDPASLGNMLGIGVDFDGDPGLAWQKPRIEAQRKVLEPLAARAGK